MNEQKNDKWLDELISRTINTTKPQFDPEKWQQKYPDEFQTLLSRAKLPPQRGIHWVRDIGITAIAASLILLFCLLSISILNKNKDVKIDTSPYYILPDYQTSHLQETKPWDILPPVPSCF
ncbi:MAG: hypothetical protein ACYS6W_15570 [Planctomycetota bacterium]|jgi:hypothetical protein